MQVENDPERLLRLPQVLNLLPISRATFLNWVAEGFAPKSLKLRGCTFWRAKDLQEFINREGI
jgi:predicted DNA-binding transcriptional regulator AlpA